MRAFRWSVPFFILTAAACSQPPARSAETLPPPQPAQPVAAAPVQVPPPAAAAPVQVPPPAPPIQARQASPPGRARVQDAQGQPCPDGKCPAPLTCIKYYGIAGPRGPAFTSCEIPCAGGAKCPPGQTCGVIADGPGQVCRPTDQP